MTYSDFCLLVWILDVFTHGREHVDMRLHVPHMWRCGKEHMPSTRTHMHGYQQENNKAHMADIDVNARNIILKKLQLSC